MTEGADRPFEWNEVASIFNINDAECTGKEERQVIMARINKLVDQRGRDWVIRKIALTGTH